MDNSKELERVCLFAEFIRGYFDEIAVLFAMSKDNRKFIESIVDDDTNDLARINREIKRCFRNECAEIISLFRWCNRELKNARKIKAPEIKKGVAEVQKVVDAFFDNTDTYDIYREFEALKKVLESVSDAVFEMESEANA